MQSKMSKAGPAAKAEARKRGARIAVSQKERPGRPLYRKAVTVWMLTAQGTERTMIGLIQLHGNLNNISILKFLKKLTV